MQDTQQGKSDPQGAKNNNRDTLRAAKLLLTRLPIGLRWIVLCALIGFLIIVAIAVLHPSLNERWKFATDMSLNLLILVVIAVQAYIYTGQWQVMREQSAKMKESFELVNRASVSVHSIELNKAEKVVLVRIENTGNMPAEHVSLFLKLVSFGPAEELETDNPSQEVKSASVREDYGRTKLFKGTLPILLTFYLRSDWTDNDFRNIEKGRDGLSLVGFVQYGDGFSEAVRRTEFCFDYHPEIGTWTTGPPEHGDILGWDED